tara:strand:+ start:68133 stop:68807 length:675 start_codon:yes stop_codon:yes gene_type:complete
MTRLISLVALSTLAAGACQKETKPTEPVAPVETLVVEAPVVESPAVVTIASVTLLEDCPEAKRVMPAREEERGKTAPNLNAVEGEMVEGDIAEGDMDRVYVEPCGQSTMQMAITGQGEMSSALKIVEVRLLDAAGTRLDIISARSPTIWKDNAYAAWDQIVLPKTDVKASYKLSIGNWSKVEKALGATSYGRMYTIEVDIELGGAAKTLRSSQAPREPMEMIET